MQSGRPVRVTATGSIFVGPGTCYGLSLTGGSDAATATIRLEGAGGAVVLTLKAAAGETVPWFPNCAIGFSDLHVTLTGTGPEVTALV